MPVQRRGKRTLDPHPDVQALGGPFVGQAVPIQQLGLAGACQTRAEGDRLADPDDILGLLRGRAVSVADSCGRRAPGWEESRLEGQPLGTLDLGLTDGKLRMETLCQRQRVRQG